MGLLLYGGEWGATLTEQSQERGTDVSLETTGQCMVPNHGDSVLGLQAQDPELKYCGNHGNSGWGVCLCGASGTFTLVLLLPIELHA